MTLKAFDPFGSNLLVLWYHGIVDRLTGRAHRANGRWGRIRPPEGSGKVIWIRAGASAESVLLAAEILGAVRQKRLDVRLVLTYEWEYPQILSSRLARLNKIGFGFGPCDRRRAIQRAFDRLNPLGVVVVGDEPGSHFFHALNQSKAHSAAINVVGARVEHRYEYRIDHQVAQILGESEQGDLLTLLVETQVEPSLSRLLTGDSEKAIWWVAGIERMAVQALLNQWDSSALSKTGVLCISGQMAEVQGFRCMQSQAGSVLPISEWDRSPLETGQVLWLDDSRWFAAVGAAAQAIHLQSLERRALWQALASGARVTVSANDECFAKSYATLELPHIQSFEGIFDCWQQWQHDTTGRRREGDRLRRAFWDERRRASQSLEKFLDRVYQW